ncbi:DUF5107 domain-containing protein [Chitinophaga arvensicola]|uniref:Tfp pilus assembly protein PilF n=1 Tax=Chitinophaga arvensicola TaxID=29529 RepID=A0A1I0S721_9BACT|nr:DUF5107 domain-containing protein [Chitinophaga arvensicola]SEW51548.1 Tfp pilus assembly protein PilF [Chitinophaga arvensicola]
MTNKVKAWKENIIIPTYRTGEPNKYPMFLEKRIYQGSSGVVYPHAVIDKVYDEKTDKEYIALFLENDYLKVMILPELGGRIQMAYDKTNDYHFIYYNQVIKPALVGLAGPWISGGIEFNWPQHHRPSTFDPVDFSIQSNEDGSQTIWVNEYEKMFRTKCALGFTLYPGKAYIELHAKLHNKTPFPQTFLWWANPAVSVNDQYQSVFPPDVYAVYDHGKRDVSSFPIATGTYYKVDYSPGTDISRYQNIPVPTSYMAVNSQFNFVGGYDHGKKAGMMHVADHHISPGKKQWTWGSGDFGKKWDQQLTDEDGPYFELMCGVYTDNQPDFSWIMPNETREFRQYFMPYKNIGYAKNAGIDAIVNFELDNNTAVMQVYLTKADVVTVELWHKEQLLFKEATNLSPSLTYHKTIPLNNQATPDTALRMVVRDTAGRELISYSPIKKTEQEIPSPATPIPAPADLSSNESLYLAGLHLEQYRHATFSPTDYYQEALNRDSGDMRCNNAMGLWLLRRGQFETSEAYFRKAIGRQQLHNPNPPDGEPLYNLGLSLFFQGNKDAAYPYFYKAAWNAAWQDNAYLKLATIACSRQHWQDALAFAEKSLAKNINSLQAKLIQAAALRKTGHLEQALLLVTGNITYDEFDYGSGFERYLLLDAQGKTAEATEVKKQLIELMRNEAHNYIELAIDYYHAGMIPEAISLLEWIAGTDTHPVTFYYLAFFCSLLGWQEKCQEYLGKGFAQSPDAVFPNRLEDIIVLRKITTLHPKDYKAWYYLGNLFYDKRQYEDAKTCWENSLQIFDQFPGVHRNLGLAYYNKFNLKEKAVEHYQKAFELDKTDARILLELDQLQKKMRVTPDSRLRLLTTHKDLVHQRDDLFLEFITLHHLSGHHELAMELLLGHHFHPWEGGEGKVSTQYIQLKIGLAKKQIAESQYHKALCLLEEAKVYPPNIGEGKLYGARENDIDYLIGYTYYKLQDIPAAASAWEQAATGSAEPSQAIFYNDQQPDKIFYQGLALQQLGRNEEAVNIFQNLIAYGQTHLSDTVKMDYFAVSFPELEIFDLDLQLLHELNCHYLMGLGWLGLEQYEKALAGFDLVLQLDPAHIGASTHRLLCKV